MPRMTSLPSTLLAVRPPPLSPLQLSATMFLDRENSSVNVRMTLTVLTTHLDVFPMAMLVSPAAQIWPPVMSQRLLHVSLSVTVTIMGKMDI